MESDWECVSKEQAKHMQPTPTTSAAPSATPTPKCKEGQKMCNKVGSVTCKNGDWVVYPCAKGQTCQPKNGFQCAAPPKPCEAE